MRPEDPRISILMPTYNTDPSLLNAAIESVIGQSRWDWELCIYDDGSDRKSSLATLKKWEGRDPRIKIGYGKKNMGIGAASNAALAMARGLYVGFLDHDDLLHRHCIRRIIRLLDTDPGLKVVYTDEAKVSARSAKVIEKLRKPEWCPDNLLVSNYMNHFTIIERELVDEVGGFREDVDGAQDHDLFLRVTERTDSIKRIPDMLYFWRMAGSSVSKDPSSKAWAYKAGCKVVESALKRRGLSGRASYDKKNGVYRIRYELSPDPLVSIIIPFRDRMADLRRCLKSIEEKTVHKNLEFILVDNLSTEAGLPPYLDSLKKDTRFKVIKYDKPFNYSAINNLAARSAKGDYLLFLNNDVKVTSRGWIGEMLALAMQEHVGIVGAKLSYPSGKIQHIGVNMERDWNGKLSFHHMHLGAGPTIGSEGMPIREQVRDCFAVTAAAMMVKASVFRQIGGFDQDLEIFFNDTDLCIRSWMSGKYVAYVPYARLIHYEGSSRGENEDKRRRIDLNIMSKKWSKKIFRDPFHIKPPVKYSILMPTYNTKPSYLFETIESVSKQTYGNWELLIVDDGSTRKRTRKAIMDWIRRDSRIDALFFDKNQGIGAATNAALDLAMGDFICFLDHDDILVPHCLCKIQEAVEKHPDVDIMYTDEARIRPVTKEVSKFMTKPGWSPDNLQVTNYINHLTVIAKRIMDKVGVLKTDMDGAQDHDLLLRATEEAKLVYRVPEVLYYWRQTSSSVASDLNAKPWAIDAGKRAIEASLERRGLSGDVGFDAANTVYRIRYKLKKEPKVSIIIPFKDKLHVLKNCLRSIKAKTTYKNYEILLVDNQSSDKDMLKFLEKERHRGEYRVLSYDKPFNYASMNNWAVKRSKGEYLLFLNNDVQVVDRGWIGEMVGLAQQDHVGVVGAKLLFPSGRIQHAGTYMVKGHYNELHFSQIHYNCSPQRDERGKRIVDQVRDTIAVTGACMMVKRAVFDRAGGMDERFRVFFNDTDLCIKANDMGYWTVYTPYAKLIHFEAVSRGRKYDELILKEVKMMNEKWGRRLHDDPFYNPKISVFWGDWAKFL